MAVANQRPVRYLQTDPKWAKFPYAVSGEVATIGGSGCGPTAAAMVIATLADASFTPVTACEWALKKGYKCKGNGTYYSYFGPQGATYGLRWEQINWSDLRKVSATSAKPYHDRALAAVKAGDMVICCMGPGNWTNGGHFILWYDVDDNNFVYINDPASTKEWRQKNTLALLRAQVKYYFICHTPAGQKEDPDMTETQVRTMVAEMLQKKKEAEWYPTLSDVPECYRPSIQKLMDAKVLSGYDGGKDGDITTLADNSIRVDETFCRIITILDRAGVLNSAP